MSELIVVGGPNGAGKTTFIKAFIRDNPHIYLGADQIAYELCPEDVDSVSVKAGREFVKRVRSCRDLGTDVIVESTLSGRSLTRQIEQFREAGYSIKVIFISLPNQAASAERVRIRVSKGGHNVPTEDIERRFLRTHANFWNLYRGLADRWYLYSNKEGGHELVAGGMNDNYVVLDQIAMRSFLWKLEN
ncbi:MAG: zeta toxin family protein [Verrucomicrobiales bacterium]|nr:zeta toxin family protein [Verrucomicrobiales bacterium]